MWPIALATLTHELAADAHHLTEPLAAAERWLEDPKRDPKRRRHTLRLPTDLPWSDVTRRRRAAVAASAVVALHEALLKAPPPGAEAAGVMDGTMDTSVLPSAPFEPLADLADGLCRLGCSLEEVRQLSEGELERRLLCPNSGATGASSPA